jgi:photosystem II stability/assembly factor-like uncharacterized protein
VQNKENYETYNWKSTPILADEFISSVDFFNSNLGVGLAFNGKIVKTTDGGKSWRYSHVVDEENFVSIFIRNEDEFFVARNRFFKTVDGGDSFIELGVDEIDYTSSTTGIHFRNDEGIIVKGGRVFKTFDSGISWESTYIEFGYAGDLHVFGNIIYITGGRTYHDSSVGEIHKSTDYGNTWEKVELSESIRGEVVASNFLDDKTGYIVTFDNKLYRTMDGSKTWTLMNELPFDGIVNDINFKNLKQGLITSSNKVYLTIDAGETWDLEFEGDQSLFFIERVNENKVSVTGHTGIYFGNR